MPLPCGHPEHGYNCNGTCETLMDQPDAGEGTRWGAATAGNLGGGEGMACCEHGEGVREVDREGPDVNRDAALSLASPLPASGFYLVHAPAPTTVRYAIAPAPDGLYVTMQRQRAAGKWLLQRHPEAVKKAIASLFGEGYTGEVLEKAKKW